MREKHMSEPRIQGIVPPMITPLTSDGAIDIPAAALLTDHLVEGGVDGVFILGTCGEAASLDLNQREEMIRASSRAINGRVPLLVGVTDTCVEHCVSLASCAAEAGATAVVLASPFFYRVSDRELISYFRHVVERLPLPVFLYHLPDAIGSPVSLPVLEGLQDEPKIIGLKDSSKCMMRLHELLHLRRRRPDWSIMIGPEALLAEALWAGADGGVHGGANIEPEMYLDLVSACRAGDYGRALEMQHKVHAFGRAVFELGNDGNGVIKGIKAALQRKGLCSAMTAPPLQPLDAIQQAELARRLDSFEQAHRYATPTGQPV